eukprot:m.758327 g.758327  ORF g.758327 m.758327 type:complete len:78 (-) comp59035_c1_seq1:193-426(-)
METILQRAECPELLANFQAFDIDDDVIFLVDLQIVGAIDVEIGEHEETLKMVIQGFSSFSTEASGAPAPDTFLLKTE